MFPGSENKAGFNLMPETPQVRSEAADMPVTEQHPSLGRAALFPVSQCPSPSGTSPSRSSPAAAELAGLKHWGQKHNSRALSNLKLNPSLLIRAFFFLLFSFRTSQALIVKYFTRSYSQYYKPVLSVLCACTGILYIALWKGNATR